MDKGQKNFGVSGVQIDTNINISIGDQVKYEQTSQILFG